MSNDASQGLRFKHVFTWGGVVIALLGVVLIATGSPAIGVSAAVAGLVSWLFSKRRSRQTAA